VSESWSSFADTATCTLLDIIHRTSIASSALSSIFVQAVELANRLLNFPQRPLFIPVERLKVRPLCGDANGR
jgi:hypothetical protein